MLYCCQVSGRQREARLAREYLAVEISPSTLLRQDNKPVQQLLCLFNLSTSVQHAGQDERSWNQGKLLHVVLADLISVVLAKFKCLK